MIPEPIARGKVREIYAHGEDQLILVASDRISAYDVIMPTPIPDKGRVLTAMSLDWFAATAGVVPNHLISVRPEDLPEDFRSAPFAGRTMLVQRLDMVELECVARGYLAGSGWREYQRHRCGLRTSAAAGAPPRRPAAGPDLHAGDKGIQRAR